jgi:pimeloyl-ACP methyl ester carboxylesterase
VSGPTRSSFVLVHGGWHGAWCWDRVAALLRNQGHSVIAPDLPAHGADRTPLADRPYERYVPKICETLDTLDDRAILVGHSSGGMIITETAQRKSERIQSLVYVSAFLLPVGKTPRDVMRMDTESILYSSLDIDLKKGISLVRTDCAKSVFYGDCSEADAEWAINQLQPEPLIAPGQPMADMVNPQPTGIPRYYIECLQDRALGPQMQRWMYQQSPCDGVYSLLTSHSPFLSAPDALTQYLLAIAAHRSMPR